MTDGSATMRTTTAPPPEVETPGGKAAAVTERHPSGGGRDRLRRALGPLASLRLTVVLMLLSIGLIFFGTLAQTRAGIWQVLDEYFRSFFVLVPLDLLLPSSAAPDAQGRIPGAVPWPGGATLGLLLLLNLLAAHAVRFRLAATGKRAALGAVVTALGIAAIVVAFLVPPVANTLAGHGVVPLFALGSLFFVPLLVGAWLLFGRRFGIVLIHASLILLLVGEFVTAMVADEGQMPIYTGQGLDWVQDIRQSELAVLVPVLDADGNETDERRVFAIHQAALERAAGSGETLELPGAEAGLGIRVEQFFPNATLFRRSEQTTQPPQATAGWGADRVYAMPVGPASGVGDQRVDQPAAVVSLVDAAGGQVERVLVATGLEPPDQPYRPIVQRVDTPAGPIELVMRFKRTYLPYTVQLAEFRHDLYPGSSVPKNFSSDVTLVGDDGDPERSALIRMNEPLRYEGKTFFQSGWIPGPQQMPGTDRGTVLQVVDNPGWTVPYIAVIVGGLGLLVHFVMSLVKFLRRERARGARDSNPSPPGGGGERSEPEGAADHGSPASNSDTPSPNPSRREGSQHNPWPVGFATIAALLLAATMLWPRPAPPHPAGFDADGFGQVAVSFAGRFKPWDSVARDTLAAINGRERVQRDGIDLTPTTWLLDAIATPRSRDDRVFRIDHQDLKHLIGVRDFDRKRFSYTELAPHLDELARLSQAADAIDAPQRSAFERAVLELGNHVAVYQGVVSLMDPHAVALPGADGQTGQGWVSLQDAVADGQLPADAAALGQAFKAYSEGDPATFNDAVAALRASQAERFPALTRKAEVEAGFNAYAPFARTTALYVVAGLCVVLSWLVAPVALRRAALVLLLVALTVHTLGLGTRVYLSGRPPVTNLYGSAVFIGWAIVLLGLLLEPLTKLGLGYLVAAVAGVCTLLVARGLDDGDTMAVLQAVLDTNFWLATHVIVITLGYAAMFVAALLGAGYLIGGAYTPWLRQAQTRKRIEAAVYGVTCFALLLSFVGTILGGIWADQSWGRFWGWDPKENGALIIVLWGALVLHARWGAMVRGPGLAGLAVLGGVVTLWSWFGVNMLGVGLHSYGFMDSAVFWMMVAVAVLCATASIALIPQRRWASLARN